MIRPAREADVERIPEIERAAATLYAPWGLDAALAASTTDVRRLERAVRDARLLVAVDADDRAIGYALVSRFEETLHLDELAVHPTHGRRGLGSALLDAVVRSADGAERVTLVTLDFVPFGAPFYSKRGFSKVVELDARLADLVEPALGDGRVAMARTLATAAAPKAR